MDFQFLGKVFASLLFSQGKESNSVFSRYERNFPDSPIWDFHFGQKIVTFYLESKINIMGILSIIALVFIVIALALVLFNVPISQRAVNIILLVIALLVVLNGSGLNLRLK